MQYCTCMFCVLLRLLQPIKTCHLASETWPLFPGAQLIQPMPIMIWLAIIVEAAITNWLDMGILLGIQFANAAIGWCAVTACNLAYLRMMYLLANELCAVCVYQVPQAQDNSPFFG